MGGKSLDLDEVVNETNAVEAPEKITDEVVQEVIEQVADDIVSSSSDEVKAE